MAGEFDFLEWIATRRRDSDIVRIPTGDDLAGLKIPDGDLLLVGVDQILDGVHFDSMIHTPHQIGLKGMNRNLSDCAAMACLPAAAVATVALPKGCGLEYAKELYLGMEEAADAFDCPIVGGDTSSWPGNLAMTVTIMGRSAGVEPVRRSGAKVGDSIYVSGPLGGSISGRHMTFTPRVKLAREIAERGRISAMIDLSDGLSRDVGHICEMSGVGAVLDAGSIPIHDDAITLSRGGKTRVFHALHDGEDYELLCTGEINDARLIRVGVITAEPGVYLREGTALTPLKPLAWEHRL